MALVNQTMSNVQSIVPVLDELQMILGQKITQSLFESWEKVEAKRFPLHSRVRW